VNAAVTPDAFLSYTRIDDQFYGGSITAFRKWLELGVRVATGRADFSIFQDIDGTGLGEQYEKLFDKVIANALIFIPIVTPLFFNSEACRGELQKFLDHEKKLGRDDLVLPIYYVTAPVLEKADLRAMDPLAIEIEKRERYDWREQTKLAIDNPAIKSSLLELAQRIAAALSRTPDTPESQSRETADPANVTARLAERLTVSALRGAVPVDLEKSRSERDAASKTILWVDDNPDNNRFERHAMAAYNIKFELALSTEEALTRLKTAAFDAIISDMGRRGDSHAGFTLLKALRDGGDQTPYFIYSSASNPEFRRRAQARGVQWETNIAEELIAQVLQCLQRPPAT
jgi:CheY-like chemotaxis protein